MRQDSIHRALDVLRGFDTFIIVDDSESMSWYNRWQEVGHPSVIRGPSRGKLTMRAFAD